MYSIYISNSIICAIALNTSASAMRTRAIASYDTIPYK